MRLKTFIAPTLSQAKEKVREELGENAIIISTISTPGGGVEIKAAIDATPVEKAKPDETKIKQAMERRIALQVLAHLRSKGGQTRDMKPRFRRTAEAVRVTVAQHGAGDDFAEALAQAANKFEADNAEEALAGALELTLSFAPLTISAPRPIMLVGPTGAGKTSSVARLAARALASGEQPKLFGADVTRAGAVEQIKTYADALKTPFWTVDNAEDLARSLAYADHDGPILIDAPGINPYDEGDVDDIRMLIAVSDAEPVLVLPASGDRAEFEDLAELFSALGARRMIITKFDSSRRIGAALAAARKGDLALAHFGVSPFIADGLRPAAARPLADRLMRDAKGGAHTPSPYSVLKKVAE